MSEERKAELEVHGKAFVRTMLAVVAALWIMQLIQR